MKVRFSIVIPVFNAKATLSESLDSIVRQTYRQFEVVIVNDGSTDQSSKIIEEWKAKQDFRVDVLHQENKGLGAARNAGIAHAKNPWIAFLDADDIWNANKLELLNDFIQKNQGDVYYHQVKSFGLGKDRIRKAYTVISIPQILRAGNPIVPSATVVARQIFSKYPFTENRDYHGAEDLHLWLHLLKADKKFLLLKAALCQYRESGGMSTKLEKHLGKVFKMLDDLYHHEQLISKKELALAKKRKYFEAARFYHKRKKFNQADRFYQASKISGFKVVTLRLLNFLRISV